MAQMWKKKKGLVSFHTNILRLKKKKIELYTPSREFFVVVVQDSNNFME
jgi:hypothetical protein